MPRSMTSPPTRAHSHTGLVVLSRPAAAASSLTPTKMVAARWRGASPMPSALANPPGASVGGTPSARLTQPSPRARPSLRVVLPTCFPPFRWFGRSELGKFARQLRHDVPELTAADGLVQDREDRSGALPRLFRRHVSAVADPPDELLEPERLGRGPGVLLEPLLHLLRKLGGEIVRLTAGDPLGRRL